MDGKEIFHTHILYGDVSEEKKKHLHLHTLRVVELCMYFEDKLNRKDLDVALLHQAAWCHDIAKFDDKDHHHEKKVVKKVLRQYTRADVSDILLVITNHKGDFEKDNFPLESAILRICDKLDKFTKGQKDASEKCEKSYEKIKKSCKDLEDFPWEDFKKIYKKLYKKLKKTQKNP